MSKIKPKSEQQKTVLTPDQKMNFEKAKIIFANYNRMKAEIEMLKQSIAFYSKNIGNALSEDISNLSMSHPCENSGGYSPNVSANKIVNIACSLDNMKKYYSDEISKLKYKLSVFSQAVSSVDILTCTLSEEKSEIIRMYYCGEKRNPVSVIAEHFGRSEKGVRNIINESVYKYSVTANYDLSIVVELLA